MRNPLRRTARPLDERSRDTLMRGRPLESEPAISGLVVGLRELGEVAAPEPSDALAAMLAHGVAREDRIAVAPDEQPELYAVTVPTTHRVRPSWALAGLAAAVVAVFAGAAANALPATAQDAVATAVGWVTPIELPHHEDSSTKDKPAPRPKPTVAPEATPTPTTSPRVSTPPVVVPQESAEPEPTDLPSEEPTDEPVEEPTDEPTDEPTEEPTDDGTPLGLDDLIPLLRR